MTKNADETNKIGPGEKCLVPTDKCFWKEPQDIDTCRVKTCSFRKKQPTMNINAYNNYFEQKKMYWKIGSWNRTRD